MPKKKSLIYSVKLEVGKKVKIVTLRIGEHFTELSLAKNGKLSEIMREENGEITHQKIK